MNILFDFGAIKSGGGTQLSLNFLEQLSALPSCEKNSAIVIPEIGPLAHSKLTGFFKNVLISPNSYVKRIGFEYLTLPSAVRALSIKMSFTFFGTGLPVPAGVESIVQVAYPIICYPESPFWNHLSHTSSLRIRALNRLRVHRLKQASRIIAETEVMRHRLSEVLGTSLNLIEVIPPAPSEYVHPLNRTTDPQRNRFLFVSGNAPHKNLWRLYSVAERLKSMGMNAFSFILTVSRESYVHSLKETSIDQTLLSTHFRFLGNIHPSQIMTAYEEADVVCSLSDLESFTNNYMEAWTVGLPLIASNRDFALSICGDSAIYVEPHDIDDVACKISSLLKTPEIGQKLVMSGKRKLAQLPTQSMRFQRVMQLLNAV
jgi:glycosyltransferase involved in cell wall biosynthesis